ncbi:hypothetical protein JCM19232_5746 [Vibrio ishigakensis]|uniref:YnhF family membrane protein n=1 Tax=Vibrio ishigakensis TaxID=1481914 RepID=A0A0B8Q4B0_9VIBR|nr:hypothetical protein JCM19231_4130 [Vibrio ishigakensis]GAM61445.1 hypothetical protein JCM19232_5746 [Vibrio ishigakensis]GAM69437.1 hypothetical protein JCM19236_6680 [Vibrio sp. JCM 19236]GAM73346.1 hypothetical protein JCM19241_2801 [Vibrio ishigakensis]
MLENRYNLKVFKVSLFTKERYMDTELKMALAIVTTTFAVLIGFGMMALFG